MNTKVKIWFQSWKSEIYDYKYAILLSLGFLIVANIINYLSSNYVDKISTTVVTDIILDHIPVLDIDLIFSYGLLLVLATIFAYVAFYKVKDFHRITFQLSILVLVRSFFITLTHLGMPAHAIAVTDAPQFLQILNYHNDLFFSGHTAIPFMAFLVFKGEKIRFFFLAMTLILAATVLFMHVHYSIDVFSAFFITYGTFVFGEWFLRRFRNTV
jgi:hypothetical protein